jgi:hypothetical protein
MEIIPIYSRNHMKAINTVWFVGDKQVYLLLKQVAYVFTNYF